MRPSLNIAQQWFTTPLNPPQKRCEAAEVLGAASVLGLSIETGGRNVLIVGGPPVAIDAIKGQIAANFAEIVALIETRAMTAANAVFAAEQIIRGANHGRRAH